MYGTKNAPRTTGTPYNLTQLGRGIPRRRLAKKTSKTFERFSYPLHFCSRGREIATHFPDPRRSLQPPGGILFYWPIVLSLQRPPSRLLELLFLISAEAVETIFSWCQTLLTCCGRFEYSYLSVSQYPNGLTQKQIGTY